jgi:hypothetical protein
MGARPIYKERSKEWLNAAESTKEIYDRRHHWLIARFGEAMIWDFTREQVKQIRDLKEFFDKPSVADATVSRLATLWDYAEEFCHLSEMVKLNGINPARGVKKLTSDEESESAPVWPLELCKLFEKCASKDLRKFYFLGRYGGQRRSDPANGITLISRPTQFRLRRSKPATGFWCHCRDRCAMK